MLYENINKTIDFPKRLECFLKSNLSQMHAYQPGFQMVTVKPQIHTRTAEDMTANEDKAKK